MAVIVPAVLAAAYGAYNIYQGSQKEKEAKRLAAANKRPVYQIPQGEQDNLSLAGYYAQQGLSEGAKQTYLDNASRGLSVSVDGILKGGGNPNDINKSYDTYLGNMSQVALVDDQRKLGNIQQLITQRQRMSDYNDKEFQINEFAPYSDRATAIYGQAQRADQQRSAGIGQAIGAVGSLGSGIMADYNISKIKNGGGSGNSNGNNANVTVPDYGISAPTQHQSLVGPTDMDMSTVSGQSKKADFYNVGGQPQSYWQQLSPEDQQLLFNLTGTY